MNLLTQSTRVAGAIWNHPANCSTRVRSLLRAFGWQIDKRLRGRPWVIPFHGLSLKCFPDSTSASAAIYFNGLPDFWEMSFVLAYLKPGDQVLDVGANIGLYTLLAASCVGDTGGVDAVEPQEAAAARIEQQCSLNGLKNVCVHRLAAGDRAGTAAFGYSEESSTMHLCRESETRRDGTLVQTIRLDELCPDKRYALGKMDVEGAEPAALRGATERLRAGNPPVWLVELAGYSRFYGVSSDELVAYLADAGYGTAIYDPEARVLRYNDQPWTLGVQNVLAVSRDGARQVAARLSPAAPVSGGPDR